MIREETVKESAYPTVGETRQFGKQTTLSRGLLAGKREERFARPWQPKPFFLSSDPEIPQSETSRSFPNLILRQTDVPTHLRRQMFCQISDLPPPPARADEGGEKLPRAEAFEKIVHPLIQRDFNYGLIFVHDWSVPERASAQVLSKMKSDVIQADERVQTRRRQVTSGWLENAGKAGKMTV